MLRGKEEGEKQTLEPGWEGQLDPENSNTSPTLQPIPSVTGGESDDDSPTVLSEVKFEEIVSLF